ncbi:MAG: hypothetical protein EB107_02245, partial [Proteobacteria bacterium]|nr:hypothetical protein [Pseudomonadota bacterium]
MPQCGATIQLKPSVTILRCRAKESGGTQLGTPARLDLPAGSRGPGQPAKPDPLLQQLQRHLRCLVRLCKDG